MEGGAMNTCLRVLIKRNKMDSELLLKFIEYFPDYLSALSRTLLRFSWTTFVETAVYICFDKGCPTGKHQSVRDNTERHDGLWSFTVASSSSRVFSAMEDGAMNTCLRVLKEIKWNLSF